MGDPDSEHLAEHFEFARRLAGRLVRDASLRDDLLQDAWVAALGARPRDPQRLRAWLATLVRRMWGRTRRSGARRLEHEQRAARAEALPSTDELAAAMEVHRRVVDAVMELPEAYRRVIMLRYYDDLSVSAIAERSGEPADTVRTRLRRGIERLRAKLGRSDGERWLPALTALVEPQARAVSRPTSPRGRRLVTIAASTGAAAALLVASLGLLAALGGADGYLAYGDGGSQPADVPVTSLVASTRAGPLRGSQDTGDDAFSRALGLALEELQPLDLPDDPTLAAVALATDSTSAELERAELYVAKGASGPVLLALVPLARGDVALLALDEQHAYLGAAVLDEGLEGRPEWKHFVEGFEHAQVPRLEGARPRSWLQAERERAAAAVDDAEAVLVDALLDLLEHMNEQASVFNLPREGRTLSLEEELDMMSERYTRVAGLAPRLRPLFGDAMDEFESTARQSASRALAMKEAFAADDAERGGAHQRQIMSSCRSCHFMKGEGHEGRLADASARARAELGIGNGFWQIGHDLRIRHFDRERSQEVADALRRGALLIDAL